MFIGPFFWWYTGSSTIILGGSEYQLVSTGNCGGNKTTSADMVKRIIGEQLRDVLGDGEQNTYIAPVECSSAAPTNHLASAPAVIDNLGYNTLTRVVRDELRRFRADTEAAAACGLRSSSNTPQSVSCSNTTTGRGGAVGDYEEIDSVMSVIDQRHNAAALGTDDDGNVPQHPAPSPLRGEPSSAASPPADDRRAAAVTVPGGPSPGSAAETPATWVSAGDSVRDRRAQVDEQSVIQLLERIEQSSAELDASFATLVDVGLRSPGDWQRLARQLPICKPAKLSRRIARIEAQHRNDPRRQAAAALAEWRSYRRNKATLSELVAALRRCDLVEEAWFMDSMSESQS